LLLLLLLLFPYKKELVTYDQVPTFPFEANPLVTQFTGIGIVPVMGSHGAASILCAVSPLTAITEPGESSPINIVALPNEAQCKDQTPRPTPSPDSSPSPTADSPVQSPTPAPTSGSVSFKEGIRFALFASGFLVTMMMAMSM
jgi:hypothetical protein